MEYADVPWILGGCVGTDFESWFPKNSNSVMLPMLERVCGECVIKEQCDGYATEHEEIGFWAGVMRWENDDGAGLYVQPGYPGGAMPEMPQGSS